MKTIYDVLDNLSVRVMTPTIVSRTVRGSVVKTVGRYGTVTAPTVEGYDFLCWIWSAPAGWVGVITPSSPILVTSNFYVQSVQSASTASGDFNATALYQKKTV